LKSNKTMLRLVALLVPFSLVAAACGDDDDTGATTTTAPTTTVASDAGGDGDEDGGSTGISGDVFVTGSSTVEPVTVKVAENFEPVETGVRVSVEGPGTGDGFKKFCAGEADISNASRTIKDSEAEACEENGIEYVGIKVAYDGLAVITNPANDAIECLALEDLYALFGPESRGFSRWSDAQELAAELGSDTAFPDAPLTITAPGTESGTYDAFIEIALGPVAKLRVESGAISEDDAENLRPDYASSADDNTIIAGITASDTSLGFVGLAFAEEAADEVKTIEIDGGDGCVAPTPETTASGEYPIARDLFIYVSVSAASENPAVAAFVSFYISQLSEVAAAVGYVTMSDEDLAGAEETWAAAGF
jgi:phosphate transport system substrate-binding protein